MLTIGPDKRIAATVVAILQDFLDKKENVVVYVCDSSDNREKVRFHKFNNWFKSYGKGTIIQLRGVIRAGNKDILNAMFIHKDNPLINDFIEAYEIITGIFTKPDDEEMENIMNEAEW